MNDPFGEAIQEYFKKGKAPDIQVDSNYTEGESIPVGYFFRDENEMPALEQTALKHCRGTILDVGAAAGCHSLVLQKKGFNVTALEKSAQAADVCRKQGVQKVICADICEFAGKRYDTILLLMNGTGIGGTIEGLKKLLGHLKTLLTEKGQVLIDSSDIRYLFEEEDGSMWVDLGNERYYGEMDYEVTFRKAKSKFNWLFIDFEHLKQVSEELGLSCSMLAEGGHYDYLARITK